MAGKKKEEGRAWKPKTVKFYSRRGEYVFDNVIDVFTSKLAQGSIAVIDRQGKLFISNLPFVVLYERIPKNDKMKGGEKK